MTTSPRGRRRRAIILGLFVGVQVLDGLLTYLSVGVFGVATEMNPLLAWYMAVFGVGPTVTTAKTLAIAGALVLDRTGWYATSLLLTNLCLYFVVVPGAALVG